MSDNNQSEMDWPFEPFEELFTQIPREKIPLLIAKLQGLGEGYFSTGDPRLALIFLAYHQIWHYVEMDSDAKAIEEPARGLIDPNYLELFVQLVRCMHAAHDIIQDKLVLGDNERESAAIFNNDFAEAFREICPELENGGEIIASVQKMGRLVIEQGTEFIWNDKKTPALKNFVAGNLTHLPKPVVLAMVIISLNDVSRMLNVRHMLKTPQLRQALAQQYDSLKDTILMREFKKLDQKTRVRELKSIEQMGRRGADLYANVRNSLRKKGSNLDFDGQSDEQLAPVCGFMQIFGQSLRINFEKAPKQDQALVKTIHPYLWQETDTLPNLSSEDIKNLYALIEGIITSEISPNGFSTSMTWLKDGILEINAQAIKQLGTEVIHNPYNMLWNDYVDNARGVLSEIKKQAQGKSGDDLFQFQKNVVLDCLKMARNQTGPFLRKTDLLQANMHRNKLH